MLRAVDDVTGLRGIVSRDDVVVSVGFRDLSASIRSAPSSWRSQSCSRIAPK